MFLWTDKYLNYTCSECIMVFSRSTRVAINKAIKDLDAVHESKDNSKNLALLELAQSNVKQAIDELKERI